MKRPSRTMIATFQNTRPSHSNDKRKLLGRLVLALAAAGGMSMMTPAANACDQCDSIEVACDSCDSMGGGCKTGRSCGIFRALDAVAGGVEKIMGFDKCGQSGCGCDSGACDSGSCDSGCDSMMGGEVMMPMAPAHMSHPMHSAPVYSAPQMPTPPMTAPRMSSPRMAAPRAVTTQPQLRMSEPMIVSPRSTPVPSANDRMEFNDMESGINSIAEPRSTQPRVVTPKTTPRAATPTPDATPNINRDSLKVPTPSIPSPKPKTDGGGLFDALEDPFGDDVRAVPRYRPTVQPSNYRKAQLSHPIRLQSPQARTSTHQSSPKAAMQHRSTRSNALARQSTTQPSSRSQAYGKTPLRTGSSFRNYGQNPTQVSTPTRQVSHQHTGGTSHAHRSTPTFSPAPAPRQKSVLVRPTATRTNHQSHTTHRTHATARPVQGQAAHVQATRQTTPTRHIQPTGQRHSSAGYSGYGHTTNRR